MDYCIRLVLLLLSFFQILDRTWQTEQRQSGQVNTISDLVYHKFGLNDGDPLISFCNRRFNSTHQFGCSSSIRNGILYSVNSTDGLKPILENKSEQLILLINVFDFDIINSLRNNFKISGIIFYRRYEQDVSQFFQNYNTTKYSSYSNDGECPNSNFKSCSNKWQLTTNPFFNFANINWPFPIFYVQNNSLIDALFRCMQINGNDSEIAPCRVGLQLQLYGAINTKRCISRNTILFEALQAKTYCSPVIARNIFSPILPIFMNKPIANESILVLTARMDSFTMFNSFSPGLNSVYSGLIVLITVADILRQSRSRIEALRKELKQPTETLDNILLAMFDGESFGYVGSSSWLFSNYLNKTSERFLRNITVPKLSHVIEVNQLLTNIVDDESTFWVHANWTNPKMYIFANKLVKFANSNNPKVDIRILDQSNRSQPPSTIEMFQRFYPNLTAILLTGFNDKFTDPFYHSFFDHLPEKHKKSTVKRLYNISKFLAEYLFYLLTQEKVTLSYDIGRVQNLSDCLFQQVDNCNLFGSTLVLKGIRFNSTTATRDTSDGLSDISSSSPRLGQHLALTKSLEKIVFYATSQITSCIGSDEYPDMRFVHEDDPKGRMMSHESVRSNKSYTKSSQCLASQARVMAGYSPYFDYLDGEDEQILKWFADNPGMENKFSSLAESDYHLYRRPSIHIFLIPSAKLQFITLTLGCLILAFSFCLVFAIERKGSKLFVQNCERKISCQSITRTTTQPQLTQTTTTTLANKKSTSVSLKRVKKSKSVSSRRNKKSKSVSLKRNKKSKSVSLKRNKKSTSVSKRNKKIESTK